MGVVTTQREEMKLEKQDEGLKIEGMDKWEYFIDSKKGFSLQIARDDST